MAGGLASATFFALGFTYGIFLVVQTFDSEVPINRLALEAWPNNSTSDDFQDSSGVPVNIKILDGFGLAILKEGHQQRRLAGLSLLDAMYNGYDAPKPSDMTLRSTIGEMLTTTSAPRSTSPKTVKWKQQEQRSTPTGTSSSEREDNELGMSILTKFLKSVRQPSEFGDVVLQLPRMWLSLYDGYMPQDPVIPMEERTDDLLYIHTWHSGPLFANFQAAFDALLVSQDLQRSRLIVWMDVPWLETGDPAKRRLIAHYRHSPFRFIEFRHLEFKDLAELSKSCWKDRPEFLLGKPMVDASGVETFSDILRFLLLATFGGVWIDTDTMAIGDYRVIHETVPERIVTGKVEEEGDPTDTNRGFFNTNFMYVSDRAQRNIFIKLSCDFRIEPSKIDRVNYTSEELQRTDFSSKWRWFRKQPPGPKGQPLKIFNGWIFNDGLPRHCSNHPELCRLEDIHLRSFDPLWMGIDLHSFCESNTPEPNLYVKKYARLFRLTSRLGPVKGGAQYWRSVDFNEIVWGIHNRASHCRTYNTKPLGTFKTMWDMVRGRLGDDPRLAPLPSTDWIAFDGLAPDEGVAPKADFFTIILKSRLHDRAYRNIQRWQFNELLHRLRRRRFEENPEGTIATLPSIRLFFAISPYPQTRTKDTQEGHTADVLASHLIAESTQYGDIITVGPLISEMRLPAMRSLPRPGAAWNQTREEPFKGQLRPQQLATAWGVPDSYQSSGVLPSLMELAVMKWAYHFDSEFLLFMYRSRMAFNLGALERLLFDLETATHREVHQSIRKDSQQIEHSSQMSMHELLVALPRDDGSKLDDRRVAARLPVELTAKSILEWNPNQPSLWDETVLDGLLASRFILPTLLDRHNPARQEFNRLVHNKVCIEDSFHPFFGKRVDRTQQHGSGLKGFLSRRGGGVPERQCLPRTPLHPLVDRLDLRGRDSASFNSIRKHPTDTLQGVAGGDFGLQALHANRLGYSVVAMLQDIATPEPARGECWTFFVDDHTNGFFRMTQRKAERAAQELFDRALLVTDTLCPGTALLFHLLRSNRTMALGSKPTSLIS